jgi:1-deoxy-D-xylulose-5-phosphate reductoisomerase
MASEPAAKELERRLRNASCPTEVLGGAEALCEVARDPEADMVMAAIVGAACLPPALAAARAGKKLLLANKEALVMAGPLFMRAVRDGGARLLPIDSEHNAIFQSLPADYAGDPGASGVRGILLTASGGPFRTRPREDMTKVTPEEACAHPNWSMGRKISVDSATMMNKGLEVIEAHWLFNVPAENIQVVVHRESVIHSLVQYVDGSVLAELGPPDMRTPIAQALAYPERIASGVEALDLSAVAALHFERPDFKRFPCLGLAYQALRDGESAPATLNAANEVAVERFLERRLGFVDIPGVIARVMERTPASRIESLDDVLAADAAARRAAERIADEIALPDDRSGRPATVKPSY